MPIKCRLLLEGWGRKAWRLFQAQWESVLGAVSDVCLGMGLVSSVTCVDMGLGSHRCKQISFPYEYVPFCLGHYQDPGNVDSEIRSFFVSSFLHHLFPLLPEPADFLPVQSVSTMTPLVFPWTGATAR